MAQGTHGTVSQGIHVTVSQGTHGTGGSWHRSSWHSVTGLMLTWNLLPFHCLGGAEREEQDLEEPAGMLKSRKG